MKFKVNKDVWNNRLYVSSTWVEGNLDTLKGRIVNSKRYKAGLTQEEQERLNKELSIIEETGTAGLFLLFAHTMDAFEGDFYVHVEGELHSSFICYLLGITQVNPMLYNLPFEALLNEETRTIPPITLRVPEDCKQMAIQRLVGYIWQVAGICKSVERFTSLQRTLCDYVPAYDAKWLGLQLIRIEGDEEFPMLSLEEAEEMLASPIELGINRCKEDRKDIYEAELKKHKPYCGIPVVNEILQETQGMLLYREQFYEICRNVLETDYETAIAIFRILTDKTKPVATARIKELFEEKQGELGVELFDFLYENVMNLLSKGYIIEDIQLAELKY